MENPIRTMDAEKLHTIFTPNTTGKQVQGGFKNDTIPPAMVNENQIYKAEIPSGSAMLRNSLVNPSQDQR